MLSQVLSLAGSDTTAISLRACFYYLIKTPRAYKRLIDEILAADQAGQLSPNITYEECLKLPYLQAAMKEAMRLHPGVGFPLERFVPEGGATICGEYLPTGTNVSISAPVLHINKEVWGSDAEEFRPERWIDADAERTKVMDRNFLAVCSPCLKVPHLSRLLLRIEHKLLTGVTVRIRRSHMHRQKHINHGNG